MRRSIGEWHVVALDLWHTPGQAEDSPANAGLPRALDLLARAAAAHPEVVWITDVSRFTEFERWLIYGRLTRRCGFWGYALAEVFGSRSRAGSNAGLGVPVLSLYFREAKVSCVTPHRDGRGEAEGARTILDVLRMLGPAEQERLFNQPV